MLKNTYPGFLGKLTSTKRNSTLRALLLIGAVLGQPGSAWASTEASQKNNESRASLNLEAPVPSDPLPSWMDSELKTNLIKFIDEVTTEGSEKFVKVNDRVAAFDNDGTLWSEQPIYSQGFFLLNRIQQMGPMHPEWAETEPFRSALKGDIRGVAAAGEVGIGQLIAASHANQTVEEFETHVEDWIKTAVHPVTKLPYEKMIYQPMLELIAYLKDKQFTVYIVTGGGEDFLRPWTQSFYGIPREQVIGSTNKLEYVATEGALSIVKKPEIDHINDREGKPTGIYRKIGKRPILAIGNSDGDIEMLEWVSSGNSPSFCALLHHTDSEREWAYDRQSSVGKLDRGFEKAATNKWILIDMKSEWKVIFANRN